MEIKLGKAEIDQAISQWLRSEHGLEATSEFVPFHDCEDCEIDYVEVSVKKADPIVRTPVREQVYPQTGIVSTHPIEFSR